MITNKTIVITGGAGFIFSVLVDRMLEQNNRVLLIDKLTYASSTLPMMQRIGYWTTRYKDQFQFWKEDINDVIRIPDCDYLVHAAAESHNDNSIANQESFIKSNILGTEHLLQLVKAKSGFNRPVFCYISTDEVLGDNPPIDGFREDAPICPSSPYSASKAAAEALVMGYGRTFGIEWLICRPTNCYGPRQYPEKLIPKNLRHLQRGEKMTMYGDGSYKRVWLDNRDCCNAVKMILEKGARNNIYHISGDVIKTNLEVLKTIYDIFNEKQQTQSFEDSITIVPNRAGEDKMYLLNDSKTRALGWEPFRKCFEENVSDIIKMGSVTNW